MGCWPPWQPIDTEREKKNSTSSNTFVLRPYFQPLQEQTCLTLGGKKGKITLNISVGYNYHQWLINRAVYLWETCSIKSVGQCVCQQIALVYFPWRLSPALYPTCFISCPCLAPLMCISGHPRSPISQWLSEGQERGVGKHMRPLTSALWPGMTPR